MKNNLKIFIISGKAKHGKTTTARMIKDYFNNHNMKTVVTSYGKYIKMYIRELTDWDGSPKTKPREMLQQLGTEIIRVKLGKDDFYIKRLDDDCDVYNEFVDVVCIDDARVPIEIEHFKEKYPRQVCSIHINRPNFENGLDAKQKKHMTEIGLDNYTGYDYTIINAGSLDDLRAKVYKLLEGMIR